jgi:ribonuclease HI
MTTELKLEAIHNLILDYLASGKDMLISTQKLLNDVLMLTKSDETTNTMDTIDTSKEIKEEVIIISCDASIKTNPGGPSAIGVVIRFPEAGTSVTKFHKYTPAITNNEAEYDAIYEGLMFLANTINRPRHPVVVHSDSQLIVKQLKQEYAINHATLQRKFDSIHALAKELPVPISIEWHPRNSTPDLTEANFLAQDALGIRRH